MMLFGSDTLMRKVALTQNEEAEMSYRVPSARKRGGQPGESVEHADVRTASSERSFAGKFVQKNTFPPFLLLLPMSFRGVYT